MDAYCNPARDVLLEYEHNVFVLLLQVCRQQSAKVEAYRHRVRQNYYEYLHYIEILLNLGLIFVRLYCYDIRTYYFIIIDDLYWAQERTKI